jgi:hypothetical protein
MKTFAKLILFFALLLAPLEAPAIQEVILDIEGETEDNIIEDDVWFFDMGGKTLQEKLEEIKRKEYKSIGKARYLLEEILTKEFENSPVKTMHLFAYYRANASMDFYPDDEDLTYNFNTIDTGINGKFRDGKTYYEARLRFNPQSNYSVLQYMPSNIYIANTSIPHHTVIVGHTRTATGHEGSKSSTIIPMIARSQISRTLGNTRKLGVRLKGHYDLIEYDLGGFSSDTYFREFFPGAEFAGWVTLKPLGKTNGKYGRLKLGSGITAGQNDIDYLVAGAYASYEYKNLYANFEWAKADGYNGAKGLSSNKAEGLYTTIGYRITPKLQWVARYDQFKPNLNYDNDIRKEYSTGFNYFIKGQAVKLMLNYVYCQNEVKDDSHRIILGTQLLL